MLRAWTKLFLLTLLLGMQAVAQWVYPSLAGVTGFDQLPSPPETSQVGGKATQPRPAVPSQPQLLTREDAENIAIAHNPNVKISSLLAKAQEQVVRDNRADELPNLTGDITGVDANEGSRISAGALSASRLIYRAGLGVQLSQLITDFGHTKNLIASESLRGKARQADVAATRAEIILAADQVFYRMLEATATLHVAQQTVQERQTLVEQVSALTASRLKSDLDLSFAKVDLSQARLLQLNAQNSLASAKASLAAVLGFDHPVDYEPVEDHTALPPMPPSVEQSVADALQKRPDLRSLHFSELAAQKFRLAQREKSLPSVSAIGVVGYTPLAPTQYFGSNWYGAVGININVPIFNGFRYSAEAAEAALQASAQSARTQDLRNKVIRDVRTAWLTADSEFQRVTVTEELLTQASQALSLAQTRYQLGLSSIVELSQAQLQQTQAAIDNANARAQYGMAYSDLQFETGAR